MNRTLINVVMLLPALFILLLAGCSEQDQQEQAVEQKPIAVSVQKVERGSLQRFLNYKGTSEPWKRANIMPEVSGRIRSILKKQGDRVEKGQLLAELDTTTLKLQRNQADAALSVARASFKDASLTAGRLKTLSDKKAIARAQYEKAQLSLEVASTQLKSAEANLALINHTLKNASMRAPFTGIVTSKNMEEGDVVNPMMGMGPGVLTVMDLQRIKVRLDVPPEDVEVIKTDLPCSVLVDSYPDIQFDGKVYTKNLAADPVSKTFKVEVIVDNPDTLIKAGIFVEVNIEVMRLDGVLTLPIQALIDDEYVILFDNGRARRVPVTVGLMTNSHFEIKSGLKEGQEIVVEGNYDLKEGALIGKAEDK